MIVVSILLGACASVRGQLNSYPAVQKFDNVEVKNSEGNLYDIGLIKTSVLIDGDQYQFIIDSGSNSTLLFNKSPHLTVVESATFSPSDIWSSEASIESHYIDVGSFITAGGKLNIKSISVVNIKASPLFELLSQDADGVIGYSFFKNRSVKFNFKDSTLEVSKVLPTRVNDKLASGVIPLTLYRGLPVITAQIMVDDKTEHIEVLIDTGANDALYVKTAYGLPTTQSEQLTYTLGSKTQTEMRCGISLGLNGHSVLEKICANIEPDLLMQDGFDAVIGMKFLRQYEWVEFNYSKNFMRLGPKINSPRR